MPSLLKMTAEMGLNISPFQAGMRQAGAAADHGFTAMAGALKTSIAGYFGWEALKASVLDVASGMKTIKERSEQLSISTDEVQKLGIAAEHVGLSFDDMALGLQRLGAARAAALASDEKKIAAFNRLGAGGLLGSKASDLEVMKRVGENLRGMKIDSETLQALRELFGRSGAKLIGALKELNSAEFGTLIKEEDIDKVKEMEIELKALGREWKAEIAPAIGEVARASTTILKNLRESGVSLGSLIGPLFGKGTMFDNLGVTIERLRKRGFLKQTGQVDADLGALGRAGAAGARLAAGPIAGGPVAGPNFISPHRVQKMQEAQLKLEEELSSVIFARANHEDKIGILKRRITEADEAMADLATLRNQKLIDEVEYQHRIAEWKTDQLKADQKIYDLNRKGNLSNEDFRLVAHRYGTFGGGAAIPETVSILKKIENGLGRGKVILGR